MHWIDTTPAWGTIIWRVRYKALLEIMQGLYCYFTPWNIVLAVHPLDNPQIQYPLPSSPVGKSLVHKSHMNILWTEGTCGDQLTSLHAQLLVHRPGRGRDLPANKPEVISIRLLPVNARTLAPPLLVFSQVGGAGQWNFGVGVSMLSTTECVLVRVR